MTLLRNKVGAADRPYPSAGVACGASSLRAARSLRGGILQPAEGWVEQVPCGREYRISENTVPVYFQDGKNLIARSRY